jgi:hypothetical protein
MEQISLVTICFSFVMDIEGSPMCMGSMNTSHYLVPQTFKSMNIDLKYDLTT